MRKLADALYSVVTENPFFLFGLSHRLINLSKMAHSILPLVMARTQKTVQPSAILMGLSRLQKNLNAVERQIEKFRFEQLTVHSELCSISWLKTAGLRKKINLFLQFAEKKKAYVTVSEGMRETTLIFDQTLAEDAKNMLGDAPKNAHRPIASISMQYSEKYNLAPGMLYQILQQIALQNINVIEIASTYTEFIFYIEQKDVKLAFDTLYNAFGKKGE